MKGETGGFSSSREANPLLHENVYKDLVANQNILKDLQQLIANPKDVGMKKSHSSATQLPRQPLDTPPLCNAPRSHWALPEEQLAPGRQDQLQSFHRLKKQLNLISLKRANPVSDSCSNQIGTTEYDEVKGASQEDSSSERAVPSKQGGRISRNEFDQIKSLLRFAQRKDGVPVQPQSMLGLKRHADQCLNKSTSKLARAVPSNDPDLKGRLERLQAFKGSFCVKARAEFTSSQGGRKASSRAIGPPLSSDCVCSQPANARSKVRAFR